MAKHTLLRDGKPVRVSADTMVRIMRRREYVLWTLLRRGMHPIAYEELKRRFRHDLARLTKEIGPVPLKKR